MAKRNKTLYIIDGHAHIYAAYYAPMRSLTGPGGEPTKTAYIFTSAIIKLIEQAKPDMLDEFDYRGNISRIQGPSFGNARRSAEPDSANRTDISGDEYPCISYR